MYCPFKMLFPTLNLSGYEPVQGREEKNKIKYTEQTGFKERTIHRQESVQLNKETHETLNLVRQIFPLSKNKWVMLGYLKTDPLWPLPQTKLMNLSL